MPKAVRMLEQMDGWYDGSAGAPGGGEWHDYPPKGEVAVLDDSHADDLITSGRAEAVQEERRAAPETAVAPQAGTETRAKPPPAKAAAAKAARAE